MAENRTVFIHLYLPEPSLFSVIPPALLKEVDSLWIELSKPEDLETVEKCRSNAGCEVVPVIGSSSGEELVSCMRDTAAVRLEDEAGLFSSIPQQRRKKLSVCIIDDAFMDIARSDEGAITKRLELTKATVRELREKGFQHLTVNLYHPDPAVHFRSNVHLFQELKVRPVVSLVPVENREKMLDEGSLVASSLSLSPILYEGIADGLLVRPAETQFQKPGVLETAIHNGKLILAALKLIPKSHSLISCPVCGRCLLDLSDMARMIKTELERLVADLGPNRRLLEEAGGIRVAVMGCNVNGPGEARDADIGVAGGKNCTGTIFMLGNPIKTVQEEEIVGEMVKGMRAVIEKKIAP
jgi:4-hydroxy-3-methylbut-2-en-1-yl diphosphate synthase IspG/GcpE